MFGYRRIGCIVPEGKVADPFYNAEKMALAAKEAAGKGATIALFPELAVTGASARELFRQGLLQKNALLAAEKLIRDLREENILLVFGCPLLSRMGNLYNGVLVAGKGELIGALTLPPPQEDGSFFSHEEPLEGEILAIPGDACELLPAGKTLLSFPGGTFAIANSMEMGAKITLELSPELLLQLASGNYPAGSRKKLASSVTAVSGLVPSFHACVFAGCWESTADGVAPGFAFLAENGELLKEYPLYTPSTHILYGDMDCELLSFRRQKAKCASGKAEYILTFDWELSPLPLPPERNYSPMPFIPEDPAEAEEYFREIFAIQTTALAKRLTHTGMQSIVLGLSGGLDSTLALLAAVETFSLLNRDPANIHIVTMPGFGTSSRTKDNAVKMAALAGGTLHTVDISKACLQHFADIGHDPVRHDLTYENSQARERTQILMDMANMYKALVLGTGDLSEIALGWCTYNGDHMSMYGINASIPKTLMRNMVLSFAGSHPAWKEVLEDVVATPVSPELLPPDENGEIAQKTENVLGAYELHDFYLYHFVKNGFSPEKIFFLAQNVFSGKYPEEEIRRTLSLFFRRFFTQQFKRSCMPEGPAASGVSLSPRNGDLQMPSDISMELFKF